jgi:ATP-dependent DNA ligase
MFAEPIRQAARWAGWLHEIKHDGFRMSARSSRRVAKNFRRRM